MFFQRPGGPVLVLNLVTRQYSWDAMRYSAYWEDRFDAELMGYTEIPPLRAMLILGYLV